MKRLIHYLMMDNNCEAEVTINDGGELREGSYSPGYYGIVELDQTYRNNFHWIRTEYTSEDRMFW